MTRSRLAWSIAVLDIVAFVVAITDVVARSVAPATTGLWLRGSTR